MPRFGFVVSVIVALASSGCRPTVSEGGGGGEDARAGACEHLAEARCELLSRCHDPSFVDLEQCRDFFVRVCEDPLDLPGVTVTAMDIDRCAAALGSGDCEAAFGTHLAACNFSGSRPPRAPCISGEQCTSGTCSGQEWACGVCFSVGVEGEACLSGFVVPGPNGAICGEGLYCGEENRCTKLHIEGESCGGALGAFCASGLACAGETCETALAAGARCDPDADACDPAAALACDASTQRCTLLIRRDPGLGESCPNGNCAFGLSCDGVGSGHCVKDIPEGAPCLDAFPVQCAELSFCQDGVCSPLRQACD